MSRPRHRSVDLVDVARDDELVEALRRAGGRPRADAGSPAPEAGETAQDAASDPAAALLLALLRDVDQQPDVLEIHDVAGAQPEPGGLRATGPRHLAPARHARIPRRAAAGGAAVALSMLCVSGVAAAVTDRPGLAPYVGALQRGADVLREFTYARQAPSDDPRPAPTRSKATRGPLPPAVASALREVQQLVAHGETTEAAQRLDRLREDLPALGLAMPTAQQSDVLDEIDQVQQSLESPAPGGSATGVIDDPATTPGTTPGQPTPTDTSSGTAEPSLGTTPPPTVEPVTPGALPPGPTPDSSVEPTPEPTPQPTPISVDPTPSPSPVVTPVGTPTALSTGTSTPTALSTGTSSPTALSTATSTPTTSAPADTPLTAPSDSSDPSDPSPLGSGSP